jgi:nicotinamidase-related amidase
MATALLIIDVQQALCVGDEAGFEIDRVLERINMLGAKARAAGIPVVLVQHEEPGSPLQYGEPGWQLADGLVAAPEDLRVRKSTPDSFHNTGLQGLLQERNITDLIICGQQSDCCVDSTVRRALALGYNVVLAADAHSTIDNGVLTAPQIIAHHNQLLRSMNSFGPSIAVTPAAEITIPA